MKWWVMSNLGKAAWSDDLYERCANSIARTIRRYFQRVRYDQVVLYAVTATHRDFIRRSGIDAIVLPRRIDRNHTRIAFGKNLRSLRRLLEQLTSAQ